MQYVILSGMQQKKICDNPGTLNMNCEQMTGESSTHRGSQWGNHMCGICFKISSSALPLPND